MTLHLSLVVTGNKNTMKDGRGMGSHRNDRERETNRERLRGKRTMYVLLWGSAAADRQSVGGTVQLVFGADRELMSSC